MIQAGRSSKLYLSPRLSAYWTASSSELAMSLPSSQDRGTRPPPQPGPILTERAGRHLTANRKGVELANLAGDTLDEVITAAERRIQRIWRTNQLTYSFLRRYGQSLWSAATGPAAVAGLHSMI